MTMTVLHIASPFAVTLPDAASNSSGGLAAPKRNDTSGRGGERDDHDPAAQSIDPAGDVVIGVVSSMEGDPFFMAGSSVEAVTQAYLALEDDAAPDRNTSNRAVDAADDTYGSAEEPDDPAVVRSDQRL